jgi:hypothetical protein
MSWRWRAFLEAGLRGLAWRIGKGRSVFFGVPPREFFGRVVQVRAAPICTRRMVFLEG